MLRAILAFLFAISASLLAANELQGRIVYRRGHDGGPVFTVNADGSDHTELEGAPDIGEPFWSPDGTRIAIGHVTMSAGGFGAKVASPGHVIYDWSRDGEWLAVVDIGDDEIDEAVAKVHPDGSDYQVLTAKEFSHVIGVEWSPDGSQILVLGWDRAGGYAISLVDADGGPLDALIEGGASRHGAHWSADGQSIYYVAGLAVLGGLRRVDIANRSTHVVDQRWQFRKLFAVSPDGQYFLADGLWDHGAGNFTEVAVYDLYGDLVSRITDHEAWPGSADWFIPRSLLPVSSRGKRAVTWATIRARVD